MSHSETLVVPKWVSFTKTWHNEQYDFISPQRAELSMSGKNVVVTGGGSGIGRATAIAFAQAGARSVSILGRRESKLQSAKKDIRDAAIPSANITVLYEVADLTNKDEVERAFANISGKVGKLDILVNNAGAMAEPGPVMGYDAATFLRMFQANVVSSFNTIQTFIPLAGPKPILITVSASLAHIQPMPGMSAYTASKAAQLKMVEYFAAENPQIHAVNMHPGLVATEIGGPDSDMKGQDTGERSNYDAAIYSCD